MTEPATLFDASGTVAKGVTLDGHFRLTDHYQTLRSVSDHHIFAVCRDGEFYSLPDHVCHRGPWQGMHRGELASLAMPYLLDIEEQGYSLLRCELAVFKPD